MDSLVVRVVVFLFPQSTHATMNQQVCVSLPSSLLRLLFEASIAMAVVVALAVTAAVSIVLAARAPAEVLVGPFVKTDVFAAAAPQIVAFEEPRLWYG